MKIHTHIGILVVIFLALCFVIPIASSVPSDMSTAILIRVDQSGKGDFKKIQDAINSVPSKNSELYFISVAPGVYKEKIIVPADKPYITISGSSKSANKAVITGDGSGDIYNNATFSVLANDFVGSFLTIQNSFGRGRQAVALLLRGDRAAFNECRILSNQDTLFDDRGGHYFQSCYIEGTVDFIFGNGSSLYEKCQVHSLSTGEAITAQGKNSTADNTSFTFLNCRITGVGKLVLGRPWKPYSTVVFAVSYMSEAVLPEGWRDWQDRAKLGNVYYGQYKCYGPGANLSKRVKWSRVLTDRQAARFLWIGRIARGWLRPEPTSFKKRPRL